jgi:hypothetical protein
MGLNTREIALISILSSIWITAQITLGPMVGRISLGPISLHGVINRLIGWMLILILAQLSTKFGKVTIMSSIAAMGTRIIRLSALTGLMIGAGYALGGLIFDLLHFMSPAMGLKPRSRSAYLLISSTISGTLAIIPYLLFKLTALGPAAFLAFTPLYLISTIKGTVFSIAGTSLALSILPRLKSNHLTRVTPAPNLRYRQPLPGLNRPPEN